MLVSNCVLFGRLLRRAGLPVDPGQTRDFARAITLIGLGRKPEVKAAGRATFVRRREERAVYDAAFELFWRRRGAPGELSSRLPRIRQEEPVGPGAPFEAATQGNLNATEVYATVAPTAASEREVLRNTDFAQLTPAEARDAARMIAALRPHVPRRPARRHRSEPHGARLATRRMLRRALATGGETLEWRWLRRTTRPRPIALICDISGSMERYSRFLLRFAHALGRSGAPVEVFVFATRLTRITRQLRTRNPDDALRRVAERVVDWSGGTRIGESLHELNRRWVRRTLRGGALVLLVSDGWERGDPAQLGRELATLRRSCHRLIWLDPLAGRPGFEPTTAGLTAAIPHLDALLPCATVTSLEQLARNLAGIGESTALRRLTATAT